MSYIYQIKNEVNGKLYIGSTIRPSYIRKYEHFSQLRKNIHKNSHLQRAFNKYGEDSFTFSILEEYKFPEDYGKMYIVEYLLGREYYFIEKLNAEYNIKIDLTIGNTGYKHTEETKDKIRKSKLSKTPSERTLREVEIKRKKENGEIVKRGIPKGWKHSEESIEKIRKRSNKEDNKLRIKEIQKISAKKRIGKHHPKEVKLKMVITRFGGIKEIEIYKSGELINVCNFISEASKITGIKTSAIKNNLCGLSKTAGGYIFKYKNLL